MSMKTSLGLDIAKAKFDAALFVGERRQHQVFANTPAGIEQLQGWLSEHAAGQLHVCLEATGRYGEAVATALHMVGHRVSVINPARLKAYAHATMTRTKTDKTDALLLAQFCQTQTLPEWHPASPEQQALQALVRRSESLQTMRQQERNRLASGVTDPFVCQSLQRLLTVLDEELAAVEAELQRLADRAPSLQSELALLDSIPGIALPTARHLLAEIQDWRLFANARQLTAQAGLTPQQRLSGTSVHGKPRLSKIGSARLRKSLYWPAIVAMRCNPVIRDLADRLKAKGKPMMVIIGAAMRKLLVLAYGVLKSGLPFDPNYTRLTPVPA